MAAIFYHHIVGDLTVGKPQIVELSDADTLTDTVRAIAGSPEGAVPVWRVRTTLGEPPSGARFLGMISAVDIAAFVATAGAGDRAMGAAVGEVVQPNPELLREEKLSCMIHHRSDEFHSSRCGILLVLPERILPPLPQPAAVSCCSPLDDEGFLEHKVSNMHRHQVLCREKAATEEEPMGPGEKVEGSATAGEAAGLVGFLCRAIIPKL